MTSDFVKWHLGDLLPQTGASGQALGRNLARPSPARRNLAGRNRAAVRA